MGTIIILLLVIGGYILYRFFSDINKQNKQVVSEGGMLEKYQLLIGWLVGSLPGGKIYKVGYSSVDLGLSIPGAITMFYLTQTFGSLIVLWKFDNQLFGKHSLEWTFDEQEDQEAMIAKINKDLTDYQSIHMNNPLSPDVY